MGIVNSPRACVICGVIFYPSLSQSLFHCEKMECKEQFNAIHEEIAKLGEENGHQENEE